MKQNRFFGGLFFNYAKTINSNIGKTLTSEKAKKIRRNLIVSGIVLVVLAILCFIFGIIRIFSGFEFENNDACPEKGEEGWFDCKSSAQNNQFSRVAKHMLSGSGLLIVATILVGVAISLIYAGLAILITGEGSKFIGESMEEADQNFMEQNTPEDEKTCNNCGARLILTNRKWKCPYCENK